MLMYSCFHDERSSFPRPSAHRPTGEEMQLHLWSSSGLIAQRSGDHARLGDPIQPARPLKGDHIMTDESSFHGRSPSAQTTGGNRLIDPDPRVAKAEMGRTPQAEDPQ